MSSLTNRRITHSQFRVPHLATVNITGWRITDVRAWGKHLYWMIDHPTIEKHVLHTHLRMEGTWLIHPASDAPRPNHLTRLLVRVEGQPDPARKVELQGHALGLVELWPLNEHGPRTAHLGPDPLAADWTAPGRWEVPGRDEAVRRLTAQGSEPVHVALQNQRLLAGIGNEYATETSFLLGLYPLTPVEQVDVARLVDQAACLMRGNLERLVRTFTGIDRDGERTFVFGRNHKPCRRCGTRIRQDATPMARSVTAPSAGQQRIIWWCPRCQRSPRPGGLRH